tara:strand:+ start:7526 stop:10066 length:2541 start_codon:yes stop_codon:yes gene_type:complete
MNISYLKEQVEQRFEKKIIARNCSELSDHILENTNRSIGAHTLKRFFGFVKSNVNPSVYTLDTIAIYLGFENFKVANKKKFEVTTNKTNLKIDWAFLQEEARRVTLKTLDQLKRFSGISYDVAIHRDFSENFFEEFLESDKSASAFVAPGGYGKTITVCKLLEMFWIRENPKYTNDVVWLISASDLARQLQDVKDYGAFITENFSPNNHPVNNVAEYLKHVGVKPKGRIIIVVDGFDEVTQRNDLQKETFKKIVDYVSIIRELNYCKFLLTMRTSTWKKLTAPLKGKDELTRGWYGVIFDNYGESYSNIPLLTTQEINNITRKYCANHGIESSIIIYERMTHRLQSIISHPFYLQLFLQSYKNPKKQFFNRLDLIEYYVKEHIFSGLYGEEKVDLIKHFCLESDYARNGLSVKKSKLYLEKNYRKAYAELVSFGVFQEEKIINKFHTFSVLVSFSHTTFFDYFLAIHWIEKFGGVSQKLFEEVSIYYKDFDFREYIINWFILIAIKDHNFTALKGLFNLQLTHFELSRIGETLGFNLRDYEDEAFELFKHYAKDPISRIYFYETTVDTDYLLLQYDARLDIYLKYNHDNSLRLGALSMRAFARYLSLDRKGIIQIHKEIETLNYDVKKTNSIYIGRHYGIKILFEYALTNKVKDNTIEIVFDIGKKATLSTDHLLHFPCYYFHILEAFVMCGMPREAMRCVEYIKANYPNFDQNQQSGLFQIMGAYFAWTFAKLGQIDQALEMLESVDTRYFGLKVRNYFQIELDLLWADVLLIKGRTVAAIPKLQSVIDRSRVFKYKWSECNALMMLGNCYQRLEEQQLGHNYHKQAAELNEDMLFLVNSCECDL